MKKMEKNHKNHILQSKFIGSARFMTNSLSLIILLKVLLNINNEKLTAEKCAEKFAEKLTLIEHKCLFCNKKLPENV